MRRTRILRTSRTTQTRHASLGIPLGISSNDSHPSQFKSTSPGPKKPTFATPMHANNAIGSACGWSRSFDASATVYSACSREAPSAHRFPTSAFLFTIANGSKEPNAYRVGSLGGIGLGEESGSLSGEAETKAAPVRTSAIESAFRAVMEESGLRDMVLIKRTHIPVRFSVRLSQYMGGEQVVRRVEVPTRCSSHDCHHAHIRVDQGEGEQEVGLDVDP